MKHLIPSASIAAAIAFAFALSACVTQPPSPLPPNIAGQDTQTAQAAPPMVGGDRDAHGCIGSAGYSWCETTQQCERPWELAKQKGFANSVQAYGQFCRNGAAK
ncbi:hypothetical protein [Burkholderia sp. Ac-20344]|uniref:hypothetical protein n=1 Tax=Burkholderia sp. Ac-20344 TaxID=2703890 RepID=UPI00197C9175|nr:hypothetical protein [Burkholderia sp. Ac-20344]MBN3830450.1 hypothetical protein [Burkholderia sp. Ac-20344]